MTNWQPIETAPKDGTFVIVAVTGGPHRAHVHEAYWHPGDDRWEPDWWIGGTHPSDYYSSPIHDIMAGRVSHWMPLPYPPQNEGGGT